METHASQKGFFTVIGLSLLMVFLLALGGMTVLGFLLKKKMSLSSHCVHSVLKLQDDLKRPLERLLQRNNQALRLRLQRKAAQVKLASAMAVANPALIAAARARLTIVTERQLVLKAQQQALLMEAHLRREQFHLLRVGRTPGLRRKSRFPEESGGLAVVPRPSGSLTPNYDLQENFKEIQGQTYRLTQNLNLPLVGFQKLFSWGAPIRIHENCSATLKRKGLNQWQPVLKKAKASWRHSYGSL